MAGSAEMTILQYFHHIDQDITLAVNAWSTPVTDWFWQFCSDKLVWIPFYAAVLYFFFRRLGWKKAVVCILACVLAIAVCDQLGNLVKNSVQRLRPCWDLGVMERGLRVLETKGGKYGFYSSHAANAAAFAVCSVKLFRMDTSHRYATYAKFAYLWAFLVGASRIFVGKHFFGDVCTGFAVGILVGYGLAELARLIVRRLNL